METQNHQPQTENERIIQWLKAAVEYNTLTSQEAQAYYEAYLELVEEEI